MSADIPAVSSPSDFPVWLFPPIRVDFCVDCREPTLLPETVKLGCRLALRAAVAHPRRGCPHLIVFPGWCGREKSHLGQNQQLTKGAGNNGTVERKRGLSAHPNHPAPQALSFRTAPGTLPPTRTVVQPRFSPCGAFFCQPRRSCVLALRLARQHGETNGQTD
jgi:hypothetical protein